MVPPLITLEEHFFSTEAISSFEAKYSEQLKFLPGLAGKLQDLGGLRLQDMDAGSISIQVVSHGPGTLNTSQCRAANNQLATAVAQNKARFAGFAVLPMKEPAAAADELIRCIRELGFVGALIDNHVNGKYYDGVEYYPVFQAAQDLDVPIYLHPTWPSEDMAPRYSGNFSDGAAASLGASGFGWHSETALHILRLFAAGVFDKFPRLKIIVGHFGEMLPFMLQRVCDLSIRWGKFERPFKQVWDENIWITTSGVWSLDPMACILRNTKIEHILYSVDYPFAKNEKGLSWMEDFERSGLVGKEDLERIAFKNAETLLRIKITETAS
ncbi:amidohydrolase 2 [Hyaloscypha variabilis F]|uniref:Amidohydrolase 2 n=1 Tax=Hyaloscypha variabilis (strain UAMH 11265 / GT02V1 / F) TaxID=1149755 RepID=A0A2J6RF00_HYAVF|nr:amidohydrolase 2 [Hyaloscypha variabilis F]